MIRFQRHDALHPEKETTVDLNLLPLLVFAVGYFITRSLLGALPDKT
ncbi:hypothetical protein GCM10022631_08370 [Deinococcus rubellus]|uniref:Uncharacterized protein n=1 Tax=Deinococcus rubellus TaxID=1889240 RepID=A0ABY5YI91_9DEIO|nr:hypothetical protein [Deinococcus rubellus]UWX63822.1 hypothetical protein N0D28_13980 [Deinococcus rubellus]